MQCGWSLLELYVGGAVSLKTWGGLVTLNDDARRHAGLGLQTLTLSWVLSPVLTGPSTERRLDSIVCVCVYMCMRECGDFLVCLAAVAIHKLTAVRDIQIGIDV